MFYVLLALLIISCILYVYFYERKTKKQIFVFKVSTSFFLLMFGLYIFYKEKIYESYNLFIILGLFFGFIGDIFLGLRNLFIKIHIELNRLIEDNPEEKAEDVYLDRVDKVLEKKR